MSSSVTVLVLGLLCIAKPVYVHATVMDSAAALRGMLTNVVLSEEGSNAVLDTADPTRYKVASASEPANITYSTGKDTFTAIEVESFFLSSSPEESSVLVSANDDVLFEVLLSDVKKALSVGEGLPPSVSATRLSNSQWIKVSFTHVLDGLCRQVVLVRFTGSVEIGYVKLPVAEGVCSPAVAGSALGVTKILPGAAGVIVLLFLVLVAWYWCKKRPPSGPQQMSPEHPGPKRGYPSRTEAPPLTKPPTRVPPPLRAPRNPDSANTLPQKVDRQGHFQQPQITYQPQVLPGSEAPGYMLDAPGSMDHAGFGHEEDEKSEGLGPAAGEKLEGSPYQNSPHQDRMNGDILGTNLMKNQVGITAMLADVKHNLMSQQSTAEKRAGRNQVADLAVGEKIGGGGFGEVFRGSYKGKEVAVKLMKLKPSKNGKPGEVVSELPFTEAAIAGVCLHANIVQTLYADVRPIYIKPEGKTKPEGEDSSTWWTHLNEFPTSELAHQEPDQISEWQVRMVMECCDLGSVRDWVSYAAVKLNGALHTAVPAKARTQHCDRTLCALLTSLDVARGIKLLHKYKILHGDLKPHNVLLMSSNTDPRGFVAKLSDFGLSMKMAAHDGNVPDIKYGTVQYLSAEVLSTHIMTKKADVYSFGIIMWEVWHSKLFAEFYNVEKKKRGKGASMDNYRPEVSSKCPRAYLLLMKACWSMDPALRPDFVGAESEHEGNIVRRLEGMIYDLNHPKIMLPAAQQLRQRAPGSRQGQ